MKSYTPNEKARIVLESLSTSTNMAEMCCRVHSKIPRKLHEFEEIMMRKSDHIDLSMRWYNYNRPHMLFDWDNQETPARRSECKMPTSGKAVIDKQTGEEYREEGVNYF